MLLGFLCRDESDWKDLRKRVSEVSGLLLCLPLFLWNSGFLCVLTYFVDAQGYIPYSRRTSLLAWR
jgi:hypothetical protein